MTKTKPIIASRCIGETADGKPKYFNTQIGTAIFFDDGGIKLIYDFTPTNLETTNIYISKFDKSKKETTPV